MCPGLLNIPVSDYSTSSSFSSDLINLLINDTLYMNTPCPLSIIDWHGLGGSESKRQTTSPHVQSHVSIFLLESDQAKIRYILIYTDIVSRPSIRVQSTLQQPRASLEFVHGSAHVWRVFIISKEIASGSFISNFFSHHGQLDELRKPLVNG